MQFFFNSYIYERSTDILWAVHSVISSIIVYFLLFKYLFHLTVKENFKYFVTTKYTFSSKVKHALIHLFVTYHSFHQTTMPQSYAHLVFIFLLSHSNNRPISSG